MSNSAKPKSGEACVWEDSLQMRLAEPARWNLTRQGPTERHMWLVYCDVPDADRLRHDLTEQPGHWVKEPTAPAKHLTHAGRTITKQIAVVPGPRSTPEDDPEATVLFVDPCTATEL